MILKALTLENFKGIREPVRIEFAPLTLLFGSNNAGKSTIIHALIYAREILERGNADPRRTEMGGDIVDLGGFDNLVYGHDRKRSIRMLFELDVTAAEVIDNSPKHHDDFDIEHVPPSKIWINKAFVLDAASSLSDAIGHLKLGWLEIRIVWSENLQRPVIGSFRVGSCNNKKPSITILYNHETQSAYLTRLDLGELLLGKRHTPTSRSREQEAEKGHLNGDLQISSNASSSDNVERISQFQATMNRAKAIELDWRKTVLDRPNPVACRRDIEPLMKEQWMSSEDLLKSLLLPKCFSDDGSIFPIPLDGLDSALPLSSFRVRLSAASKHESRFNRDDVFLSDADNEQEVSDWKYPVVVREVLVEPLLTSIAVGTSNCLRSILSNSLYISSVRSVPERDFHPVQPLDVRRWVSGLAAWDALVTEGPALVRKVNDWLVGENVFDTGYQIEVQATKELNLASDLMDMIRQGDDAFALQRVRQALDQLPEVKKLRIRDLSRNVVVSPRDVGYGFSQLVPVLVAAIYSRSSISAIEEPDSAERRPLTQLFRRRSSIVAIEEPESNLHPAFQVVLADLFINQAKANPGAMFLVETHSEHLMLRCLRRIRETSEGEVPEGEPSLKPEDIAVHFVEPGDDGPRIHRIRIDKDGEFLDPWPRGFFRERSKELYGDDL